MSTKIQEALEKVAAKKAKKIEEKFAGDKKAFMHATFTGAMGEMGNVWKKDDKKRIYFNRYNMFYDFDTDAMEAIDSRKPMNFEEFEAYIIKVIDL